MAARILTYKKVADCEQALETVRREAIDALGDLFENRRQWLRHRRRAGGFRKNVRDLLRRVEDRLAQAELLSDLIRSSPDGVNVPTGGKIEYVDAGRELLAEFGTLLEQADTEDPETLKRFFADLAELRELAVDWFDYHGARLVYEISELTAQADSIGLAEAFQRATRLHRQAGDWFKGR